MKLIEQVRVSDIYPDPEQPRKDFEPEALNDLAESIMAAGLIQPITVRPHPDGNNYMIVAGERRWRACQLAGLEFMPCIVREDIDDSRSLYAVQLSENLHRKDLNPVEKAEFVQQRINQVKDEGVSNPLEVVAAELGVSVSWVSKNTAILKYSPEIRSLAREGRVRDYSLLKKIEFLKPDRKQEALELIKAGEFNSKEFFAPRRQRKQSSVVDKALLMARKANAKQSEKQLRITREDFVRLANKTGFSAMLDKHSDNWKMAEGSELEDYFRMFIAWVRE